MKINIGFLGEIGVPLAIVVVSLTAIMYKCEGYEMSLFVTGCAVFYLFAGYFIFNHYQIDVPNRKLIKNTVGKLAFVMGVAICLSLRTLSLKMLPRPVDNPFAERVEFFFFMSLLFWVYPCSVLYKRSENVLYCHLLKFSLCFIAVYCILFRLV